MRKNYYFLLLLLAPLFSLISQENTSTVTKTNTKKFTNDDKKFNDWSVSVFLGGNLLQASDLPSWGDSWFTPGYDLQAQINKQITHAFGMSLQYQMGQTKQYGRGAHLGNFYAFDARTKYQSVSILGDLNLSMLFRRIDNNSPFRWAAHAYAGFGVSGYKAERRIDGSSTNYSVITDQKLNDKSIFSQIGAGLRYKASKRFDVELKGMYIMTGDEEFDGSGEPLPGFITIADLEEGRDENLVTFSLGLHYKIGKHDEALQWVDPLKRLTAALPAKNEKFDCIDEDKDGVCDQWDKCLGTPEGIKVDGSGCPLDSDGDGVFDTVDKCPTIPGPETNNGCPLPIMEVSIEDIETSLTEAIQGIEFDYDKATIREVSYPKLDAAFNILESHPNYNFYVEGHTDAAGSNEYNQSLSERRAASVVRYLTNKGVPSSQLIPVGKGESDLKYPECNPTKNCPAWKNLANRRVVFKAAGEVKNLEVTE